jgi:hypothetical protein
MPRSESNTHSSPPIHARICLKCNMPMWLVHVEPDDKPDHDRRTFECAKCGYKAICVIKYR